MECTTDVSKGIPLEALLSTLKVHGHFVIVAAPDEELPSITSARMFSLQSQSCNYLNRHIQNWPGMGVSLAEAICA